MLKIQRYIEMIPWYAFVVIVIGFIVNIGFNSEQTVTVIFSTIGSTCMVYLAVHNLEKSKPNRKKNLD